MLNALANKKATTETCHLLTPACTVELYKSTYLETLRGNRSLNLNKMFVYNLKDKLERDDKVGSKLFYRKSLLYLVSNAFERKADGEHLYETPLLGMEKFKSEIKATASNGIEPKFYYSNGVNSRCTRSTSHGGFDNDPTTMNNILKVILGKKAKHEFTKELLEY